VPNSLVLRQVRRVFSTSTPLLLTLAAACASATAPGTANGVVQIAEVSANPRTLNCPNPTPIYVNIRMVNTTRDTVTVVKVSSSGLVVRAPSAPQLVGQSAYTYDSLSFTPTMLRAHDGNAIVTVVLPAACLRGVALGGSLDAYVTVMVTTTSGQYATRQLTVTFNYPPV
jgi:hypothetical protein